MKAFLAGLGTGIALGVLYAPKSGNQTREQIRQKAGELAGKAKKQVGKAGQFAGSVQEEARDFGSPTETQDIGSTTKARDFGPQTEEAVPAAAKVDEGLLLRLNTASRDELMSISGIGPVTADKIIRGRPYHAAEQLVDRGIVPESVFKEMQKKFRAA